MIRDVRESRPHQVLLLGLLVCALSGAPLASSEAFDLVLSVSKTVWQPGERVKATLVFENNTVSPITIVKTWLPSGWKIHRRYSLDGAEKDEELSGGIMRGAKGEFYSARRQPAEYVTIESHDSLKVEVDVTSWLRNQNEVVPTGEYRVSVWYRYESSEEEAALPLLEESVVSNEVRFRVSDDRGP